MSRKYANAPIVEAVCEFRLSEDSKWDLTIPGLMSEKIEDEFPVKEQRMVTEVAWIQTENGLSQQVRTSDRMLFLTENRKTFVQIGPHLLAVNALEPYPTWEKLRPRIETAFRALLEVTEIRGLARIGLRYINRIVIPENEVDLDSYFEFRPLLGEKLPQNMTSFIVGATLPFSNGRDECKVQLTTAIPQSNNVRTFVLDLDYSLAVAGSVGPNEAIDWVESAHQSVEATFEGCISDSLRSIFGEEK